MKKRMMVLILAASFAGAVPANAEKGPFERLAVACGDSIEKLCSGMPIGQGRILACLEKNKTQLSADCEQARVEAKRYIEEQGLAG